MREKNLQKIFQNCPGELNAPKEKFAIPHTESPKKKGERARARRIARLGKRLICVKEGGEKVKAKRKEKLYW